MWVALWAWRWGGQGCINVLPLLLAGPHPAPSPPHLPPRPASKSPLGKDRAPGSCPPPGARGKENVSAAALNAGASTVRLSPRTAEPAAPQPVALSAWKRQQLSALSAGFHSRQRRLLELLSACNRAQAAGAPAAGTAGEPGPKPACGAKSGRGAAVPAAAAKPPLGPRAAAVAAAGAWSAAAAGSEGGVRASRAGVARVLDRLREQDAL